MLHYEKLWYDSSIMSMKDQGGFTVLEAVIVVICVIIMLALAFFILNP